MLLRHIFYVQMCYSCLILFLVLYLQNDYGCYPQFWEEAIQLSYKNKQSRHSLFVLRERRSPDTETNDCINNLGPYECILSRICVFSNVIYFQ